MRGNASSPATWLLLCAVAAFSLFTILRQTLHRPGTPYGDFSHVALGAQCLLDRCDPYDSSALNRERLTRHESNPPVWPQAPVYPPSSLLVALPFAVAGWPVGAVLFDLVSGLLFTGMALLMIWRMHIGPGPAALMLLVPLLCYPLVSTLEFANPALLTVSLATLACLLLLDPALQNSSMHALAWLPVGLALALKPQLIAGAVLVLAFRISSRRAALRAVIFSIGVLLAATLAYRLRLGSFSFLAHLRANVAMSLLPGSTTDFSKANDESFDFLNLQTSLSRLPGLGRSSVDLLAWLLTAVVAAVATLLVRARGVLLSRPWTVIALAALIGLLPVYHRGYDRVIALLLVPAALELAAWSVTLSWAYALLACWWVANDTVMTHVLRRWHFQPQNPVEEVLLCVILLASLWHRRAGARTAAAAAGRVGSIAT